MLRKASLVLAVIVAVIALWSLATTTDRERIEEKIDAIAAWAVAGGDEAADKILAEFAADYSGSGPFAHDRLAARIRSLVGEGMVRSVSTGEVTVVPDGAGLRIPLLRVDVETAGRRGTMILTVVWGRDESGEWKIVNASRWRR